MVTIRCKSKPQKPYIALGKEGVLRQDEKRCREKSQLFLIEAWRASKFREFDTQGREGAIREISWVGDFN